MAPKGIPIPLSIPSSPRRSHRHCRPVKSQVSGIQRFEIEDHVLRFLLQHRLLCIHRWFQGEFKLQATSSAHSKPQWIRNGAYPVFLVGSSKDNCVGIMRSDAIQDPRRLAEGTLGHAINLRYVYLLVILSSLYATGASSMLFINLVTPVMLATPNGRLDDPVSFGHQYYHIFGAPPSPRHLIICVLVHAPHIY